MAVGVSPEDLQLFDPSIVEEQALAMIEGVLAQASILEPALEEDEFVGKFATAARAVLVQMILRLYGPSRGGLVVRQTDGPFTTQFAEVKGSPEMEQLAVICRAYQIEQDGPSGDGPLPEWSFPIVIDTTTYYRQLWPC
jgi:hypothetical protein